VCGRPAAAEIRREREAFCSEDHAGEFAREVAAAMQGRKEGPAVRRGDDPQRAEALAALKAKAG
jgi:hypothetical protein